MQSCICRSDIVCSLFPQYHLFLSQILDLHPEHHLQEVWAFWLIRNGSTAPLCCLLSWFNVIKISSHFNTHLVLCPNKLNIALRNFFNPNKTLGSKEETETISMLLKWLDRNLPKNQCPNPGLEESLSTVLNCREENGGQRAESGSPWDHCWLDGHGSGAACCNWLKFGLKREIVGALWSYMGDKRPN